MYKFIFINLSFFFIIKISVNAITVNDLLNSDIEDPRPFKRQRGDQSFYSKQTQNTSQYQSSSCSFEYDLSDHNTQYQSNTTSSQSYIDLSADKELTPKEIYIAFEKKFKSHKKEKNKKFNIEQQYKGEQSFFNLNQFFYHCAKKYLEDYKSYPPIISLKEEMNYTELLIVKYEKDLEKNKSLLAKQLKRRNKIIYQALKTVSNSKDVIDT